ncbi:MAG TPA: methionine aminotransferase [Bacteroidia bacterium]|jgi:methionine aminotransferase|nr:methionine aminotransferase [Bacteroidia bacterium]
MPKYNGTVHSKLPKSGTTIFTVMSALATEHNAINLSQGFPNFECAPELVALVNQYMKKGLNQYSPMQGILPLRETIAAKMQELYSAVYSADTEINITAGGTQAIYAAITAVVNEGDEVIIIEPAYDCYVPAIELNGGIPIYVKLKEPNYTIDWNEVKKLVNQRTRMIMINTPHNPTGSVMTAADMKELEKITDGTDIVILSDEVYEHIIFDANKHQSVCLFPKLAERSFVVFSFGKTYHTTGWKTGYVLAPERLMTEFRRVHQFMVFCVNTPLQYALADYMKNKDAYMQLGSFYQEKRDYFIKLIKGSKFKFTPASGSYFQMLDYSGITQEKDTEYAIRLTKEIGVASVPTSVFYHEPVDIKQLRFCFAKTNETLEKAAEKLCKV